MNHAQAAATIRKQIAELERMAQEHEAQVDQPLARPEWPLNGDGYWCIAGNGKIYEEVFTSEPYDTGAMETGNCFRTEAEAIRRCEALKVQAELRRMPGRKCFDAGHMFFGIWPSVSDGFCVIRRSATTVAPSDAIAGVWFESAKAAQRALNTIGKDRLGVWLDDYLGKPITEGGTV